MHTYVARSPESLAQAMMDILFGFTRDVVNL